MKKSHIFSALLPVMMAAAAAPQWARAEEFTTVNGLPCGDFCRSWMGIESTQNREIVRGKEQSAAVNPAKHVRPPPVARPAHAEVRLKGQVHHKMTAHARPVETETAALPKEPSFSGSIKTPDVAAPIPTAPEPPAAALQPTATPEPKAEVEAAKVEPVDPTPAAAPAETAKGEPPASPKIDPAIEPSAPSVEASPQAPQTTAKADVDETPPTEPKLVLIVLTKPDVKSAADLQDKTVAVAGLSAVTMDAVKASFATAGANKVVLEPGEISNLVRLVRGEVSAFVVDAESPKAASEFPEVSGFKIFRLPVLTHVVQ